MKLVDRALMAALESQIAALELCLILLREDVDAQTLAEGRSMLQSGLETSKLSLAIEQRRHTPVTN